MTDPLVSVMLPAYNQEEFVREAIESAADQSCSNLEVVVSDDGSTDGTVDIILECARKYPGRVIPLVNQPHFGITGNCNRNLKACKGRYIAFSAGDDVFLPGKITKQVEFIVPHMDCKIRDAIIGHGKEWIKGAAFYALIKTEKKVQPYKMVALRVKTSGKVYSGQVAREMLGIGQATDTVRLVPGDHGKFDVFIQSTSVNRKIPAGTEVLYWKKVGSQRK